MAKNNDTSMKLAFYAWAVLVAMTPVLSVYGIKFGYSPDLHMASVLQVGGVALLALCFYLQRPILLANRMLWSILALYSWMAISVFWVINSYESALRLLDWGCSLLVMLTIFLYWHKQITSHKTLERAFFILMLSGFVATIVALYQYWFGYNKIPQAAVPGSFFSNKNMAAQYMLLTIPLAVYWWLRFKQLDKIKEFCFMSLAISLMIISVFYSFALAAWVSLGVQIILFLVVGWYLQAKRSTPIFDKKLSLGMAGIVVLVLALMPIPKYKSDSGFAPFLKETQLLIDQTDKTTRDNNIRIAIWTNSWEMIKEHWFKGIGAGNWVILYPKYHQRVMIDRQMSVSVKHDNAHNDYIEIVSEFGIIGTILFILFLVFLIRRIVLVFQRGEAADCFLILVPTLGLVGIYIDAIFSFPLQQPVPIYWVFMYSAIAMVLSHKVRPLQEINVPFFTKKMQYVVAIALAYGTYSLLQLHSRWYDSEIHKRGAIISATDGRFDVVKEAGRLAYTLKPEHKELAHAYAVGLREMKQLEEADKYFDITLSGYPYTITYLTNAINNALQLRNFDKAIMLLERYVDMRGNDYQMNKLIGLVMIQEKKDYRGLKYLKDAVKLNPNSSESNVLQQYIVQLENQQKVISK